jgi:hypothetical protein
MRKYLYAGAVAGSFLLLSAAPAYADEQPAAGAQQDGGALGGLLDPASGVNLNNPLGGTSLLNVNPGDNSLLPPQDAVPPARTGFGQAGDPNSDPAGDVEAPARTVADVSRKGEGLPVSGGGLPTGALSQLPVAGLLGGGLPVIGGLLPDGRSPLGGMAANQESGLLDGGLPLLGGLGGLIPGSSAHTLPAVSGMPAGGTAVPIDDQVAPAKPAQTRPAKPAQTKPDAVDPAIANDQRLHEEPTDPEVKDDTRTFSDGRPVAGADPDFN